MSDQTSNPVAHPVKRYYRNDAAPSGMREDALGHWVRAEDYDRLTARNAELVKALEEAQRDAERYRWLQDNLGKTVSHWFCATSNLEADIDAALKGDAT